MTTDTTTALEVVSSQPVSVARAMRVEEIIEQVKLIQDVMKRVMVEKEHYGTIPGCGDKKTLLQPGAQKLTMTFRLAPEYTIQEVNLERGHKEYRIICTLKTIGTGTFAGQGVGICSTMESKYRWRGGARKCPECGKEAIIKGKAEYGGGWLCFAKKGGCGFKWPDGAKEIEGQSIDKIENENPADCYNTVLKIAKKRAFVDATITATAASDIFTQDIGDDESELKPEPATKRSEYVPEPEDNLSFENAPEAKQPAKPPTDTLKQAKVAPKPVSDAKNGTPAQRMKALNQLKGAPGQMWRAEIRHWMVTKKWISDKQEPEDWPLDKVPTTVHEMATLFTEAADFCERQQREQRPEIVP